MIAAGIEYSEAGEGVPVVCLHGIGGGIESFRPQLSGLSVVSPPDGVDRSGGRCPPSPLSLGPMAQAMATPPRTWNKKKLRVISWAMPGYGASERGVTPPSFFLLSGALGRFLETLGIERAHLVGQSIGGMVALEHAVRRPEQVASLCLIGTTPSFGGRDDSFREAFLAARLAPLEAGKSMAEMAAEAAPAIVGSAAGPEVIAAVEAPMAAVAEETWRGILECLVTFNRRDALQDIDVPVCLIAGSEDRNAPARTMAKMAEKLPDAEYHLIEGAGHMINQEAPEAVNCILRDFLERHAT